MDIAAVLKAAAKTADNIPLVSFLLCWQQWSQENGSCLKGQMLCYWRLLAVSLDIHKHHFRFLCAAAVRVCCATILIGSTHYCTPRPTKSRRKYGSIPILRADLPGWSLLRELQRGRIRTFHRVADSTMGAL
eukprot:2715254-Amphidinium_carterae.3